MLSEDQRTTLRDQYRTKGIVRIPAFLAGERATELHQQLRDRGDWLQLFNSGDKLFELDRAARAAMDDVRQAALDQAIYAGASKGFQYRYETIRVPDEQAERKRSSDPLAHLALELSGGAIRDLFRDITGESEIRFADAQATAFSPGDFLTGHDDRFAGKNRRAAYVLGLTPVWRIEWGGLLIVHGEDGEAARAYPPMMNLLTLFRVPLMHSVSEVTRAATYRRYSVTGWLRD
ncbi:MAG: 2OG-Fe(II) oxygenase family protein [Sphingomicrobium sp.]